MLMDSWGRQITYLRISVTDRCNLRCVYCMPPEGIQLQNHETILRYEEIASVVRVAAEHGVTEVRLTGGEPLTRPNLPALVGMLSVIQGIRDISLTTNGLLLERYALPLAEAGLKRINVSLDTLRPERFARITRGGSFETVWRGILAAEKAGLAPIKINVVAMRGVNDDELLDLARLALDHPWQVRFIEVMPVRNEASWGENLPNSEEAFLPIAEIKERLASLDLQPATGKTGSGPAREYFLAGGPGRIGFISPISDHFCGECNRLRLTADGHLRPCLLSDLEIPILPALRRGEPVLPLLQQAVALKPESHELVQNHRPVTRCMLQIGG
ncbi:MAG TPA: GTP 3',8-cyclase MoaA [Anaerolinea thermolimosa]|uniref:GTP 3',8-cyclase n=1 Tax=Anaerolinea thermolimosa TaxID=229919 RepID=A0A3D1JE95_9CHLR|nr:GTP 3',8-cyclase MoaA [Anaerolinea thermolimosa]GAP07350.1 cyclic pyranopterin monophosphate synthase subunit MoaA [Anaerolinea thermolimosa]HCE16911.1 GTP 3',8-cyclase MoaA [Anaerolinea thermolimosa]